MDKITGGYFLKARKIQESEIAHCAPCVRELWDWLIMNANHKDKRYSGIIVKRGQLFRSIKDMRKGLSWKIGYRTMSYSEDDMKNSMKKLRSLSMITSMKTPRGNLITICNYDYYQNSKNYENPKENPNDNPNETPMKPLTPLSINKNDKNEENEKNKEKIYYGDSVLLTEIEYIKLCERFTKIKADDMIEGMNLYAASQPKNFKKYASHYATLLNWERKNEKDNKITINSDEEICKACQFNNYPYCRKHSDKRNCKKIGGSVR